MHRRHRLAEVSRQLFDARAPLAAEEIAWRTGVRVAGVQRCLRLLERTGCAEQYWGERSDGGVVRLWRWKEGRS